MSTSMWSKFFVTEDKSDDVVAKVKEVEKEIELKKKYDETLAKWYEHHRERHGLPPTTSKAAPGSWSTSGSSPAGSILPSRPTSPAKFDFSAWEFNVACIKLAEKLGFTTPAEIYAFIKEIERD